MKKRVLLMYFFTNSIGTDSIDHREESESGLKGNRRTPDDKLAGKSLDIEYADGLSS